MVPDGKSPEKRVSRRKLLGSSTAIGMIGLVGCSADASSDSVDCTTTALEHGDGDIFKQATAMMNKESVVLFISLQEPADTLSIESILINNSVGDLLNEIPTTDAQEYRITIGSPPHHGRLTLLAENEQHNEIDSLEIEHHCAEN